MALLPGGKWDGRNGDKEQVLMDELIVTSLMAVELFGALAQGYAYVARKRGSLVGKEGELLLARLELQAEGLLGMVRKMGKGWRG